MLGYVAEVVGSGGDRLDEEDLVADDDTGICIFFWLKVVFCGCSQFQVAFL